MVKSIAKPSFGADDLHPIETTTPQDAVAAAYGIGKRFWTIGPGNATYKVGDQWVISDKLALYVSNSTGPEQVKDDSHYRSTWDATLYYTASDRLDFAASGLHAASQAAARGLEHGARIVAVNGTPITDGSDLTRALSPGRPPPGPG